MNEDIKILLEKYRNENKSPLFRKVNKLGITSVGSPGRTIQEEIYNFYNNSDIPVCPYCGSPKKFISYNKGYSATCGEPQCKKMSYSDSNTKNSKLRSYENVGRKQAFHISYSEDELYKEFEYYRTQPGNLWSQPLKNKIIKYFQQDIFYKKEKELLKDKKIYNKLYKNRQKYLHKEEISVQELLRGCKISGLYYGYSHFNPLWTKWFVEKYGVKSVFDPCGGWGHHFLACMELLESWTYNDISETVRVNTERLCEFLGIKNVRFMSQDARDVTINDVEAYFTCPPYVTPNGKNLEHYECGDFKNFRDYVEFLNTLISNWEKSGARIFGIILRDDIVRYVERNWDECFEIGISNMKSHLSKNKIHKEFLYVFKK